MSLNIVLTVNGEAPEYDPETSISFEGLDADYWYLWPTMIKDITNETGECIDLYDDAEFSGDDLPKVEKIVMRHLTELKHRKVEQWEIHAGTQLQPVRKEIYKTLIKKNLEHKLERLLAIIQHARQTNEKIICLGD